MAGKKQRNNATPLLIPHSSLLIALVHLDQLNLKYKR